MNFNVLFDTYKHAVVWFLLYIAGTCYLYFIGMKYDWQEIRTKRGLTKPGYFIPPSCKDRNIFDSRSFKLDCTRLFIITAFISALLMILFYISTSTKKFENFASLLYTFISLFFVYSVFAGAPQTTLEDSDMKDIRKVYKLALACISFVKTKCIEYIVNKEIEDINRTIEMKIRKWFNDYSKDLKVLLMRIDSDFFNDMLPPDIEKGKKEQMNKLSLKLLVLFMKGKPTLLDELLKLFPMMLEYGAKPIDLAEFIKNHEISSRNVIKIDLEDRYKEYVGKLRLVEKKKTFDDIVENIINAMSEVRDFRNYERQAILDSISAKK